MKLNPPQAIPLEYAPAASAFGSAVLPRPAVAPGRLADAGACRRLRSLILLDGTLRHSPLLSAVGRSALDLPISQDRTLLSLWRAQAQSLARSLGGRLHCRIVISEACHPPTTPPDDSHVCFTVERDPAPLRGTGGLLRDLAAGYDDDDCFLVAPAAQLVLEPLAPIITRALEAPGDIHMFVTARNGHGAAPTDVYLLSPRAMRATPAVGFVDLKEQVLPAITGRHQVVLVPHPRPLGLAIRSAASYLGALAAHHLAACASPAASDPLAERWQSNFRVVEQQAQVDPSSQLANTVVLAGAQVDAGALLANCIVCPGAVVRRGSLLIDQLVSAEGLTPIAL